MTIAEATAAVTAIPADKLNNNCVQDAQWRLRDVIKLARHRLTDNDEAPNYVVEKVTSLQSWF